ncbi:hypothetical protein, partial [Streptomyces angustmyceticus]|uniref:hypothetical protein n=1 Tax=Streptomyces angustmyceticus TaxID=285578 RepID=UPI00117E1174
MEYDDRVGLADLNDADRAAMAARVDVLPDLADSRGRVLDTPQRLSLRSQRSALITSALGPLLQARAALPAFLAPDRVRFVVGVALRAMGATRRDGERA